MQRIPGYGRKVEPVISDGLTLASWPKFLHPYPLSGRFFLVSCKPTPHSPWGIYLVDVFDNIVPLLQLPDYALFEPIPLRPTPAPPVIPDKVDPQRKDAVVFMPDIYAGDGLKGVPRGTVKALRLFTYHFAYQGMGGLLGVVGVDGPWDIKRVLGTVPVNADGSAKFRVPANTPISLQPLDAEGKAMQLMRSWMTAMPGEAVQCAGCHETQNSAPRSRQAAALSPAARENQALARPRPRLQLPARSPAGDRPVLRGLPRRTAARGRRKHLRPARRGDAHQLDQRHARKRRRARRQVLGRLRRARPLRAPAGHRERLPHADADGVPRRHDRPGADAQGGTLRRAAGRRSVGPADHLDRPELPLPRHLGRD